MEKNRLDNTNCIRYRYAICKVFRKQCTFLFFQHVHITTANTLDERATSAQRNDYLIFLALSRAKINYKAIETPGKNSSQRQTFHATSIKILPSEHWHSDEKYAGSDVYETWKKLHSQTLTHFNYSFQRRGITTRVANYRDGLRPGSNPRDPI